MQVYPASLQYLGKGGANILSILWFGMLWLLGIDSMFAMVEGVSTVITGASKVEQVVSNFETVDVIPLLTDEVMAEIDAAVG